MSRPWHDQARPDQLPPTDTDWFVYLVTVGRGWGKTRAAAEWVVEQAATKPGSHHIVIAPTWRDCKRVCIEGQSGILQVLQPGELKQFNAADLTVELSNGSTIRGFSGDITATALRERLGDVELDTAWIDELVSVPGAMQLWDDVLLPRTEKVFVTTTPSFNRPCPLLTRLLLADGNDGPVVHVKGSTWDNASNLSKSALSDLAPDPEFVVRRSKMVRVVECQRGKWLWECQLGGGIGKHHCHSLEQFDSDFNARVAAARHLQQAHSLKRAS